MSKKQTGALLLWHAIGAVDTVIGITGWPFWNQSATGQEVERAVSEGDVVRLLLVASGALMLAGPTVYRRHRRSVLERSFPGKWLRREEAMRAIHASSAYRRLLKDAVPEMEEDLKPHENLPYGQLRILISRRVDQARNETAEALLRDYRQDNMAGYLWEDDLYQEERLRDWLTTREALL